MYIEKAFYLLKELRSFLAQLVFSLFCKYSQLGSAQLSSENFQLGSARLVKIQLELISNK